MNAAEDPIKGPTPPEGSRTAYAMAVEYARKSRKYYDEANRIQSEEFTSKEGIAKYGSLRAAYIACSQDIRWMEAVENQKFMERLCNMYSNVAAMDYQRLLLHEQHVTNTFLAYLILENSSDPNTKANRAMRMVNATDYLKKISIF